MRRYCLKYLFSRALASLVFSRAKTFMQFLDGIVGNILVKLFYIWTSGSGGDVV